jgi:short/branched chain acyl-CoA dehydrogenase
MSHSHDNGIHFELPEEIIALKGMVREFAEKEIAPVAMGLDEKEEFSTDITKKMAQLGLFGIIVPEEYGGYGMDYLAYATACEELARVDASQAATITAHNSLGISPIYYFGSEEQKKKYLPQLCGEKGKLWAFGLTEPEAGSDSRGSKTRAVKVDGGWEITGSKIFITNAANPLSAGVTVQAVTGRKPDNSPELTCFLVETGTEGYTQKSIHKKHMWRASDTAELFFEKVFVPDENMLGKQGDGSKQMLQTLDRGKIGIAAMGVGCAQGAFEKALGYAKQRVQFGKPISEQQAVAFDLAKMYTKIEFARTYLHKVCAMADSGKNFTKEAAAKLYASEVALEVAQEAVKIHGGMGLINETGVERYLRDSQLLHTGEGTSNIQLLVIARAIGCYDQEKERLRAGGGRGL